MQISYLSYVPSEMDRQHEAAHQQNHYTDQPYSSQRYSRGYSSYEDPYSSESTISQKRQGRLSLRPHNKHHEDGLYLEGEGLQPSFSEKRDLPQKWERQRMVVVETARSKNRSPSANLSFHEESVSQGEIMGGREVKNLADMPPLPEKNLTCKQLRKQKHEALQREVEEKKAAKRKRHEEIMKEGERKRALKKAKREAHEASMKLHAEAKESKALQLGASQIPKSPPTIKSEVLQGKKGENKSNSKPENKNAAVIKSRDEAEKSRNGGRKHEKIVWVARPSQEKEKAPELPKTRSEAKKNVTKRHEKGNKIENLPGPPPGIPPQSAMRSKPEENEILPPPPPRNSTQKTPPPSNPPISKSSRQTSPQLIKSPSKNGPDIEERVKEEPQTVLASQNELSGKENFEQTPNQLQDSRESAYKHYEGSGKQKLESEQIQTTIESISIPPSEIRTQSNFGKMEKETLPISTNSDLAPRELSMAQNPDLPNSDTSNRHREDETMAEVKVEKGVSEKTENLPASHGQISLVQTLGDKTQQRGTEVQMDKKKLGNAKSNNNEIEDDLFEFGADFVAI